MLGSGYWKLDVGCWASANTRDLPCQHGVLGCLIFALRPRAEQRRVGGPDALEREMQGGLDGFGGLAMQPAAQHLEGDARFRKLTDDAGHGFAIRRLEDLAAALGFEAKHRMGNRFSAGRGSLLRPAGFEGGRARRDRPDAAFSWRRGCQSAEGKARTRREGAPAVGAFPGRKRAEPLAQSHRITALGPAAGVLPVTSRIARGDMLEADAYEVEHPALEFDPVRVLFPL